MPTPGPTPPAVPPALVLAAGMGSRLRALAGDLPKPMVAFAGTPILVRNLRWLAAGGVREVWITLHYRGAAIEAAVGNGAAFGLAVRYLPEETLLGTAGALANLGERGGAETLVVYGDSALGFDLAALLAAHRGRGAAATIALFDRDRHAHTGIAGGRVELDTDGRVAAFVEGGTAPASGVPDLVNAGVYVVDAAVRRAIPSGRAVDFGHEVFPALLARGGALYGHVIEPEGYCLGLDTPDSHAAAAALVAAGRIALNPPP